MNQESNKDKYYQAKVADELDIPFNEDEYFAVLIAMKVHKPSLKQPLHEFLTECCEGYLDEMKMAEITKDLPEEIKARIRLEAWVTKTKADDEYSLFCYTTDDVLLNEYADIICEKMDTNIPADIRNEVMERVYNDIDLKHIRGYVQHIYHLKGLISEIGTIVNGPLFPEEKESQEEQEKLDSEQEDSISESFE